MGPMGFKMQPIPNPWWVWVPNPAGLPRPMILATGKSCDCAHDDLDDDTDTADDDHDELDLISDDNTRDAHAINTGYASDPCSYKEAMSCSDAAEWAQAFAEEMAAPERKGTWDLVECPPGVCPVDNRWVLKTKRHTDGTIKRLKAQLATHGFMQHPGINYFETYAPTAPPPAIHTTTELSAAFDLHLHLINISNAFLNSDIDAEMWHKHNCANPGCAHNVAIGNTHQGAAQFVGHKELPVRCHMSCSTGVCNPQTVSNVVK